MRHEGQRTSTKRADSAHQVKIKDFMQAKYATWSLAANLRRRPSTAAVGTQATHQTCRTANFDQAEREDAEHLNHTPSAEEGALCHRGQRCSTRRPDLAFQFRSKHTIRQRQHAI